jgi:hypothetical protein
MRTGRRLGQRHLTPLVGRDEEIALLMRRWERARQGDGQLVQIVGEPGVASRASNGVLSAESSLTCASFCGAAQQGLAFEEDQGGASENR